ncbi:hypothetical protein CISIN_1g046464mg [Citrus sinensis]|uniref:Uncharacterized protein n=1 Tax=Citrus sinensis TaxID=2711 RepID=A0A067DM35_CITSI|nr:hypothetical protein CISIN_1g046464mg [Citrus sinensis]
MGVLYSPPEKIFRLGQKLTVNTSKEGNFMDMPNSSCGGSVAPSSSSATISATIWHDPILICRSRTTVFVVDEEVNTFLNPLHLHNIKVEIENSKDLTAKG